MRVPRHRRQVLLFLVAILLPATILIGIAVRTVAQERELAAKRMADRHRDSLEQVRRELIARLEAIRLAESNRLMRSPGLELPQDAGDPTVIFLAKLEGERLEFPWDSGPRAVERASPEFLRLRSEGEALEFTRKDPAAASVFYRRALAGANSPGEQAEGRLLLARVLAKTGEHEAAVRTYHALLTSTYDGRDEQGVGYRFYAAERLLEARCETDAASQFLAEQLTGKRWLTSAELALAANLAAPALQSGIAARMEQLQRASEFARDFPRVRAQIESTPNGVAWAAYGDEPWLVTIAPAGPPLPNLVVVVSSMRVSPPGVVLLVRGAGGESLGEAFPGLRVKWNPVTPAEEGRMPAALYAAGIALVLSITGLGSYLLLRDVNRDVRLAEVRSQFVASVSHELKTPLTAIRMFAETLAMGRSSDPRIQAEYLETIVNESERLARLVDNVLDFSKIEQGKKIYRLRPTNLADAAESAVRAMHYPLAQQGFRLNVSMEHDLPLVSADPDAIQQAILNLLTNAMKYGGDTREIDLRVHQLNGNAAIEVCDRGLGIAPEEQKRVFEKFYRIPSHESRLIAGAGLGLTLVAHIADAHGGRVELESSPGAGSTFVILIPIKGRHDNDPCD